MTYFLSQPLYFFLYWIHNTHNIYIYIYIYMIVFFLICFCFYLFESLLVLFSYICKIYLCKVLLKKLWFSNYCLGQESHVCGHVLYPRSTYQGPCGRIRIRIFKKRTNAWSGSGLKIQIQCKNRFFLIIFMNQSFNSVRLY